MKSFKKFVEARTKGAISKKYSNADREYVVANYPKTNKLQITTQIKKLRQKYVDALTAAGKQLSDETLYSLQDLKKMADDAGIDFKSQSREKRWQLHEKNVVLGTQRFLDSGKIIVNSQPIKPGLCVVSVIGGGLQSDVKVVNTANNKSFFIECKLDFESSRYFKYSLSIENGKLKYDHKRYIDSANKHDKDSVEELDELFSKRINITSFIDDLLKHPDVKATWEQFGNNIDEMCEWLKRSDDIDGTSDRNWKKMVQHIMANFNQSYKYDIALDIDDDIKKCASFLSGKYPDDFKHIAKIFDKYVAYYKSSYNSIIDRMIDIMPMDLMLALRNEINDDEFDLNDLKISSKNRRRSTNVSTNELFQHISKIAANMTAYKKLADELNQTMVSADDFDPYEFSKLDNGAEIQYIAMQLQKIEVKLATLMGHLGLDANDFSGLDKLKDEAKLKYFFKMFLSSTGRKNKEGNRLLTATSDKLGNMMICAPIDVENSRLAQMITDFYVKKDHCAYIQIGNILFQFDEKFNPLNLENLPIFKDHLTKFRVSFLLSDKLDSIKFSTMAFQPNEDDLSGYTRISLSPEHGNFICRVLKTPISVVIPGKNDG